MMTGLAYIAASVGISILLILASREEHESIDDTDYFRYPKAIQVALLIGVLIWMIIGVSAVFFAQGLFATLIFSSMFLLLSAGTLFVYIDYKKFYFAVTREEIQWKRFNKVRVMSFTDISMILHRHLDKGREDLSIQCEGKTILVLASTLQDFEVLKNLVIGNAKLHGVKIVSK